jgi:hypothetical protein
LPVRKSFSITAVTQTDSSQTIGGFSRLGGTTWAHIDTSQSGGSYELAFINPSSFEVSWLSNVIIPENQITIYVGAMDFRASPWIPMRSSNGCGATQLMSIRNVIGGISNVLANPLQYRPVNSSITFDLGGIQGFGSNGGAVTRQWYFGSTDNRNPSDPHYNDYYDFYSAAIHEIGHILGIHNPEVFKLMAGLDYDPGFCLAYMRQVQPNGYGGYVFTGSNASQHYFGHIGQNIPLETPSKCHWADGVRSDNSNGYVSINHESNGPFRVGFFSELEFGALQDIGYTVSSCTYTLSPANYDFSSSSDAGSISVTAGSGCSWTSTSNDAWITFPSGSSGTGNGTLEYNISVNTSGNNRTGTITVAGKIFTITQYASGYNLKGDTNNDWNITLADAIVALQIVTGLSPPNVNKSADVDSDGRIGLAEVIYILQKVAGLR